MRSRPSSMRRAGIVPRPVRAATGAAVAVTLVLSGCAHQEPPPPTVEAAPFRLTEDGLLDVRADIAARFEYAHVEPSTVIAEVHGVGEVVFRPGSLTALRVPFDGIIESVEVSTGATVAQDTVLARVRSSELARMRADIRRLDAELVGQYDARSRIKDLVEGDVISNRRLVETEARIGSLEAERAGVRVSLRAARTGEDGEDLYELRSPRDGQVIERHVDPGEHAQDPENQPAFVIADPTALVVTASFPERDAPLLSPGFACRVEVPALGEKVFLGRVVSVVRAIDRQRRAVDVSCVFDTPDPGIRAHMLAHVTVSVEGGTHLVVPRDAVLLRRDERIVLVRHGDHRLERRPVIVGTSVDRRIVVISGVEAGDEVVTAGAVLLDGELDRLL